MPSQTYVRNLLANVAAQRTFDPRTIFAETINSAGLICRKSGERSL